MRDAFSCFSLLTAYLPVINIAKTLLLKLQIIRSKKFKPWFKSIWFLHWRSQYVTISSTQSVYKSKTVRRRGLLLGQYFDDLKLLNHYLFSISVSSSASKVSRNVSHGNAASNITGKPCLQVAEGSDLSSKRIPPHFAYHFGVEADNGFVLTVGQYFVPIINQHKEYRNSSRLDSFSSPWCRLSTVLLEIFYGKLVAQYHSRGDQFVKFLFSVILSRTSNWVRRKLKKAKTICKFSPRHFDIGAPRITLGFAAVRARRHIFISISLFRTTKPRNWKIWNCLRKILNKNVSKWDSLRHVNRKSDTFFWHGGRCIALRSDFAVEPNALNLHSPHFCDRPWLWNASFYHIWHGYWVHIVEPGIRWLRRHDCNHHCAFNPVVPPRQGRSTLNPTYFHSNELLLCSSRRRDQISEILSNTLSEWTNCVSELTRSLLYCDSCSRLAVVYGRLQPVRLLAATDEFVEMLVSTSSRTSNRRR